MNATIPLPLLDRARIASPCSNEWADMCEVEGRPAVRFCGECRLDVYNLALMTRAEVEETFRRTGGKMCAQIYRRADGTILTRDCPVGLRAVRERAARVIRRVAAALVVLLGGSWLLGATERAERAGRLKYFQPFAMICTLLRPTPPPIMTVGDFTVPIEDETDGS